MELVKDQIGRPCHDCGAKTGENHMPGCDTERCPKCEGQLISCGCFVKEDQFDEEEFAKYTPEKWSGIMYEKEKLYAEEHGLFCYWDKNNGWVKCTIDHPEATHDLNTAIMKMR